LSLIITYVQDRLPILQARPARAVEVGNTMGGALEEDWVDVGQIGAATTAIAVSVMMGAKLLGLSSGAGVAGCSQRFLVSWWWWPWSGLHVIEWCRFVL